MKEANLRKDSARKTTITINQTITINSYDKNKFNQKSETQSDDEEKGETEYRSGILQILDGYGFLRAENCECGDKDVYVSGRVIKGMGLRAGDYVTGIARRLSDNKPPALVTVERVNPDMKYELVYQKDEKGNDIPSTGEYKLVCFDGESGKNLMDLRKDLISTR